MTATSEVAGKLMLDYNINAVTAALKQMPYNPRQFKISSLQSQHCFCQQTGAHKITVQTISIIRNSLG